jgi:hypothetical protein
MKNVCVAGCNVSQVETSVSGDRLSLAGGLATPRPVEAYRVAVRDLQEATRRALDMYSELVQVWGGHHISDICHFCDLVTLGSAAPPHVRPMMTLCRVRGRWTGR